MLHFLNLKCGTQRNKCSDGYLLRSGVPCVKNKCVQCCIETRMPLSPLDIKKILKVGYGLNDFTIELDDRWRLKNISGRCVFLSEGGCKIYPYRPEGCQLYPLIYDEDLRYAVIDHLCPYGREFTVKKEDIKKLKNLLRRLEKKRRCSE
ncbi:MAG: YkgJ family cysteine cluster protein [archaeon]|nr:YkgJ family cysteine cluster protein [archaeon]